MAADEKHELYLEVRFYAQYFSYTATLMHDGVYLFCLVPHFNVTQILVWASGEVKLEGESKHIVNTAEEVQTAFHL